MLMSILIMIVLWVQGRMIRKKFWGFYGGEYPFPSYLWESGIIYTAQIRGLKVKSFRSIKSITL